MIWNFTKFLLCPCRSRRHFLKIQSQCVAFISYESPTQKYEPNQCFLSMSLAILKWDRDPSRSQTLRGKSIPLAIAQNCFSCKNSERQHVNMSLWSMRSIMTIQTNKRFAQLLHPSAVRVRPASPRFDGCFSSGTKLGYLLDNAPNKVVGCIIQKR